MPILFLNNCKLINDISFQYRNVKILYIHFFFELVTRNENINH